MAKRSVQRVSNSTRVTKSGLVGIVNEAVDQVNEFYDLYDKFFSEQDSGASYLEQVQVKIDSISAGYASIFNDDPSKVEQIETAAKEIEAYHSKLLSGDESIQSDIEESQVRITSFYNKLFSSSDGVSKDGGQQGIIEAAVKSITDFNSLLNANTTGYKDIVENAKQDILSAHDSLFTKDKKSNKTKVELLDEQIVKTHEYYTEAKEEILPYIKKRRTELDEVTKDISNKRLEVDSLLSKATVRTLAQGYMEAMQIYGSPVFEAYPSKGLVKRMWFIAKSVAKQSQYFLSILGSYALFIGPLVAIGVLFVTNSESIFGVDLSGRVTFSGTEFIFYKLTIALPLLWVSWFGQKSISHRKRLFEEYNHKLRVVQMYMLFAARENTYMLEKETRKSLESALLKTIAKNPSEVYGQDETMLDKIIDAFVKKTPKTESDVESISD